MSDQNKDVTGAKITGIKYKELIQKQLQERFEKKSKELEEYKEKIKSATPEEQQESVGIWEANVKALEKQLSEPPVDITAVEQIEKIIALAWQFGEAVGNADAKAAELGVINNSGIGLELDALADLTGKLLQLLLGYK